MEFAKDSFELGNIWREVYRENWRNFGGKNRRVEERKKNTKDKYYEASERNSGVELSTKTPNKENITEKQDIDKRRHELLELLDSLSLCTEKMRKHRWQLKQVMNKENVTTRARAVHLRAHMSRMVM